MIPQESPSPASPSAPGHFLPLLLLAFAASGCSALIYEIVWFQLLQMVIGSTAVSIAVLLGTYMGGMGLGSLILPRLISARRHPLRVYGWLEFGIGAFGLAILFGMPSVVRIYTANAGLGFGGVLFRGAVSAVCLLGPTMMMGATLPALARWIESTPRGVSWMGFLYGSNTSGAVLGSLLAGFYLLRVHDIAIATYVAVAINVAVALVGFLMASRAPHHVPAESASPSDRTNSGRRSWPIFIAIGISGLCALGAEVIWTRLLSLILGGTVYTFSIILAVFLAGLGFGSGIGSVLGRKLKQPGLALGYLQIGATAAIAWAAFMLAKSLPYWIISPSITGNPWTGFLMDLGRCLCAVLPPALVWGASFPLALAAVVPHGGDPGRLVGKVYASNTAGAIIGAIAFGLILIPSWGTHTSQKLMIGLSGLSAIVLLIFRRKRARSLAESAEIQEPRRKRSAVPVFSALALISAIGFIWIIPATPWELIAYGRKVPSKIGEGQMLYVGEGMNSSVAVTELATGVRNFHVSGKIEASSDDQDMRLERMLGHIPGVIHPNPRSVLIVGCGAGVTAGSFVLYPGIKRIVICEIEPLIPRVVARYFGRENYDVLDDPRVEVVYDDARHYILTTKETFDIITSDPIHPWIKGSATLYSREYFELCKSHLNPGGLITQWVPLYESTAAAVKSEMATFFKVFPLGTIWSNDLQNIGYDVVLLGQDGPLTLDLDLLQDKIESSPYEAVAWSMRQVGFPSMVGLFATFAGYAPDLNTLLKSADINLDRNLRLQYLAGLGLNNSQGLGIFEDLLNSIRFPENLFVGSPERIQALRKALGLKP